MLAGFKRTEGFSEHEVLVSIWMAMVPAFLEYFDMFYHWLKGCIKRRA